MSDFWAKKLGRPAPASVYASPEAPAAPQQPVNTRAWWQPAQAVPIPTAAPQQPTGTSADGTSNFGSLLQQGEYHTTKARSARSDDRCPNCGSGNYLHIAGRDNRPMRCFDCGHNPMFEHEMAGVEVHAEGIPVFAARGQTRSTNNFNPQHIIAHIH
jgi:hypothetical protein